MGRSLGLAVVASLLLFQLPIAPAWASAAQDPQARIERLLRATPLVGIADIADHVEHVRAVAGIDHVGIGADYDGIAFTVDGLEDVASYPRLFEELARRGWSDADLKKLAGENFLRVLDAADAHAARHRPAS